jgi:hypothetical protein
VKVLPEGFRRSFVEQFRAALEGRRTDMRDRMVESGILTTDSAMTADEAWEWYADLIHEWREPQPVTFTREAPARVVRGVIDIRSREHPFRRMLIPGDLVFFGRINLNINAICAALHATFHARAMIDGLDGVAEPITPLGKQHVAWARQRGLPFGLDPQ